MTPSAPRTIAAEQVAPQAWRNGGGQTRELLVWPTAEGDAEEAWQLRISRADIEADGPFSAFPGVQRWFAVLQGAGVVLQFADGEQTLRTGEAPLCFDGAAAPGCRLLQGSTQDLNLMVRAGAACMEAARAGVPWASGHRMQGLYTTAAGRWSDGLQSLVLPAHNLLWCAQHEDRHWTFHPQAEPTPTGAPAAPAYWWGFTPQAPAAAKDAP